MANGTIAFDRLSTSGQISGTAKSVDTDYLLYGSAKVRYNFELDSSDNAFEGSFNCSSGADNGTGDATVTFTNAMANKSNESFVRAVSKALMWFYITPYRDDWVT